MLKMMIIQFHVVDDSIVQNFQWSIDVPNNVPKYDVDDVSSLLLMMLCRDTPAIVVVSIIFFLLRGSVEIM